MKKILQNTASRQKYRMMPLLLILASIAICIVACGQEYFQTAPSKIINFKGKLVEGGISHYNDEKGTATLIVLTASWCPGCRAELPHLKQLDSEFRDKGFKIVMVSEDDTPKIAAKYKKSAGIPWTMFHWNYDMMNALGNPGVIPVSYLVNAQDSIVKIDVGEFDENEMRRLIERTLKQ